MGDTNPSTHRRYENMKALSRLFAALALISLFAPSALAADPVQSSNGTITIPIKEYEALQKSLDAGKDGKLWNMTFAQILEKENNNYSRAWELYEFWGLRTIRLNSDVSESTVKTLITQISTLNNVSTAAITMVIDSPGGSVLAGFNLLNAMNTSRAEINTVCDGWAMSMAAVILANGSHRTANQGCVFMIHEVATGAPGGQTTTHIKFAGMVVDIENMLAVILSENSGLSVKDVRKAWEYETFYNANEAMILGMVDEVDGKTKRTAEARTIPEWLEPLNKMRDGLNERLTK